MKLLKESWQSNGRALDAVNKMGQFKIWLLKLPKYLKHFGSNIKIILLFPTLHAVHYALLSIFPIIMTWIHRVQIWELEFFLLWIALFEWILRKYIWEQQWATLAYWSTWLTLDVFCGILIVKSLVCVYVCVWSEYDCLASYFLLSTGLNRFSTLNLVWA
jgi:hypothetical protein